MSIAELLALADIVKNETGIGRNNAVRIGMALEEIIKYFRDNGGSGGGTGTEVDPVFEAWYTDAFEDGKLKPSLINDQSKWEPVGTTTKTIKYGRLYNWFAITDPRGIAPAGWHVPTDDEWMTLMDYLGGQSVAGGKIRTTDEIYWPSPNEATNESGFSAVGAGVLETSFRDKNVKTFYGSATSFSENGCGSMFLQGTSTGFFAGGYLKSAGQVIRLIKDNGVNEGPVTIDGDLYTAVTIGTQVWIQQNLSVRHYQNGDSIGADFTGTSGAVAAYDNDESNVYSISATEDPTHIRPKSSKKILAGIIDNLPYADGGILNSIVELDLAGQGKLYGVQLAEAHPELGIDHFGLVCIRGGSQEELIQVAIGYDGTTIKLWLRGGETNSYGAFNQISGGGGGTGDEVDPVFAAWYTESFEAGKLKPSLISATALEAELATSDKYLVNAAQKTQIATNALNIDSLQNLWSNYSGVQKRFKNLVSTVIDLEKDKDYYHMSLSTNSTVTFQTSLLDPDYIWSFDIYFETTNFVSVSFPASVYFFGGNQMTDIGLYHYHFESRDSGLTWNANLVNKRVQYISESGKIIYVKLTADGGNDGNDGLSWATAKASYEAAQNIAIPGDVIFMKSGKYLPTQYRTAGVERSRSFIIKNQVNVYGGFAGTESSPDERIMTTTTEYLHLPYGVYQFNTMLPTSPTILSGEIAGNSVLQSPLPAYGNQFTTASIANNSYAVVVHGCTNTTIMDGFVITGGNSTSGETIGAAIRGTSLFLSVKNSLITNSSSNNACISYATITNSRIANIYNGGAYALMGNVGIYDTRISAVDSYYTTGSTTINHCLITGSRAANTIIHSNALAYNCQISDCPSTVINERGKCVNLTINNCVTNSSIVILQGGSGANGRTIVAVKIINCTSNSGAILTITGTSIYCIGANILIAHCISYGGAAVATGTVYEISNLTVVKNIGVTHAGIVNCTTINSTSWGNRIDGIKENWYSSGQIASYCAFEDEVVAGTANISISTNNMGDADSPKFVLVAATVGNTTDDFDYDIQNDSFLIDKGNNSYPTNGDGSLYDCKGRTRKVDTVDIGAYENQKL